MDENEKRLLEKIDAFVERSRAGILRDMKTLVDIDSVQGEPAPGAPFGRGPKCALKVRLEVMARHGQGASRGKLLVPGVPEADGQQAKGDALAEWLAWCSKSRRSDGVKFSQMD